MDSRKLKFHAGNALKIALFDSQRHGIIQSFAFGLVGRHQVVD